MSAPARLILTGACFALLALILYSLQSAIASALGAANSPLDGAEGFVALLIAMLFLPIAMMAALAFLAAYKVSRALEERSPNVWLLRFEHPEDEPRNVSVPWFWAGLFSFLYFGVRGVWLHFLLGILFYLLTLGIGNVLQAVFANHIITNHYKKLGFTRIHN